jgi:hypothetical protein
MAADRGHLALAQASLMGADEGGEGGADVPAGQQTEWGRTGPAMADQQALHAFAQREENEPIQIRQGWLDIIILV